MTTAKIFQRKNGEWGVLVNGCDAYHVTRNEFTQRFTVWDYDGETVIADSVTRGEAETAAAAAWEAA